MISDKWPAAATEIIGNSNPEQREFDTFNKRFESLIIKAGQIAFDHAQSDKTINQIETILKGQLSRRGSEFDGLVTTYNRLYGRYKQLSETRLQIVVADLMDTFRLLLFRIPTALGIGAVVLLVGIIAKEAEIPLPMLRNIY